MHIYIYIYLYAFTKIHQNYKDCNCCSAHALPTISIVASHIGKICSDSCSARVYSTISIVATTITIVVLATSSHRCEWFSEAQYRHIYTHMYTHIFINTFFRPPLGSFVACRRFKFALEIVCNSAYRRNMFRFVDYVRIVVVSLASLLMGLLGLILFGATGYFIFEMVAEGASFQNICWCKRISYCLDITIHSFRPTNPIYIFEKQHHCQQEHFQNNFRIPTCIFKTVFSNICLGRNLQGCEQHERWPQCVLWLVGLEHVFIHVALAARECQATVPWCSKRDPRHARRMYLWKWRWALFGSWPLDRRQSFEWGSTTIPCLRHRIATVGL